MTRTPSARAARGSRANAAKTGFDRLVREDLAWVRNSCPYGLRCGECRERLCIKVAAAADFPSLYGRFTILGFANNKDGKDHIMLVKGAVGRGEKVLLRIHSACLTGDALGSRRCDCGPQLHISMSQVEKAGRGIILYHQAEGRGIGLVNKLRAYALQDRGMDTLEANVALGFRPDERDYAIPAAMLRRIGVRSVRLLTNNPEKVAQLEAQGVRVAERVPLQAPADRHSERYLKTKKDRFGHFLHLE